MHASVFVFLAGLALLLSTQNAAISGTIICIICLTGLFYIITTVLPLFFPHCCYVTPLTLSLYATWCSTRTFWAAIFSFCGDNARGLLRGGHGRRAKLKISHRALKDKLREVVRWQPISRAERITALHDVDLADVHILQWLQSSASLNPSVPPIICEAISGIREGFTQLSAIQRFSGSIMEDWESEIGHLMVLSRFSRVERYLRMNAVLYALHVNSSTLRRHPSCIGSIVSTAFKDEATLHMFQTAQMSCCSYASHKMQELSYSGWIHALLLMCTMGLKGADPASAPMVGLHPGAWINVFAYIVEFAHTHDNGSESESTTQCIQKHASVLLCAVLDHHYETSQDRQVYFAEPRNNNDSTKNRVSEPITILELPPGHCRSRFLQFLYVYSKPTPERKFSLYTDFQSFIGNMVELWHKALLLNLKQYEVGALPVNAVGVLQELAGVLQMSTSEESRLENIESPFWGERLDALGSGQSALELKIGEFMRSCRRELKEVLVQATLSVLIPKARSQMQSRASQSTENKLSTLQNPSMPPIATAKPDILVTARAPQRRNSTPNTSVPIAAQNLVGVQLVSLIEVFRRDRSTNSSQPSNKTGSELLSDAELRDVGKELLEDIIREALMADNYGRALGESSVQSPGILQHEHPGNIESSTVIGAEPSLVAVVLTDLGQYLETESDLFPLVDGIGFVHSILIRHDGPFSTMKRAQSLLAIFRAMQVVGSFIDGVSKMEARGDEAGRQYLSSPEILNKCCIIMVHAEFAMFTLNANGVDDRNYYAQLSKLRQANRSCLDRWWKDILTLTKSHPETFYQAWVFVFENKVVLPRRPSEFQANRDNAQNPFESKPSTNPFLLAPRGQIQGPIPAVALYKKRHFLWVEDIKEALDASGQKLPEFKLSVAMKEEEYNRLPRLTRWRHAFPPMPWTQDKNFEHVEFDLVKDHVNEDLAIIDPEAGDYEIGKLLNTLEGVLRWPVYNLNESDVETEYRRPVN